MDVDYFLHFCSMVAAVQAPRPGTRSTAATAKGGHRKADRHTLKAFEKKHIPEWK
ncbi:hypothetical protein [Granulicella pectinivorans]|uniref:hypothetical protein n=1 Tax=Granulicella pectinivorans TaxID=474950 RepID=UPI001C31AA7F|nr:hypothetical protein [Granulicella pectinivorans]